MIKAIHDTANTMFRDPAGACRAGSCVTLTLLLAGAPARGPGASHPDSGWPDSNMDEANSGWPDSNVGGPNPGALTPNFGGPGPVGSALILGGPEGSGCGSFDPARDWNSDAAIDPASAGASDSASVLASGSASPIVYVRCDKDGSLRAIPMKPAGSPLGGEGFHPWTGQILLQEPGLYWYWFEYEGLGRIGMDPRSGQASASQDTGDWQITAYAPAFADPEWIRGGVFYHVFVDRFARAGEPVYMDGKITRSDWEGEPEWRPDEHGEILNNDFFGGNLEGIRRKLPYLESLGVTCLYLSPIFEAYSSHKYDTSDYLRVDPMFGSEDDFRRLCADAKARGIRIICDGVFSHTGSDSRYFDLHDRYGNGACHHPDSPYRDWYYFENGSWQSWWGIKTLPRVNKEVSSYQDFVAGEDGVIRHWIRAGASGWRLDVVDELPRAFLEKLTAAAKAEQADSMVLGEVWEDASNKIAYDERKYYFDGDKLDSVMNYPLRRGLIDYVREGDARALARPLQMILDHYPPHVIHQLMNILGTHDTERIITALAGAKLGPDAGREVKAALRMDAAEWTVGIRRLKLAVVLQMTLPGVPCIYYGDEAGMEGYNDPFNRRCFPWGHENTEIQNWYRRVIRIRRENPVYAAGTFRLLAAREGLFAFERAPAAELGTAFSTSLEARRQITATNCGQALQTLHLLGPWEDLLSGACFDGDVPVLPGQAMILREKTVPDPTQHSS